MNTLQNTVERISLALLLLICHYIPTFIFLPWLIISLIFGYLFNDLGLHKKCLKILSQLFKGSIYSIRK